MENNKIIEKIKKLYEKAESSKKLNSLQEAEAFFQKVQKLLLENNLSLNSVLNFKTEEEISFEREKEGGIEFFHNQYEGFNWEPALMQSICKNNNVYSYQNVYGNMHIAYKCGKLPYLTLVGRPSDKENVLYFYNIAKEILRKLAYTSYENEVKRLRNKFSIKAFSSENAIFRFKEFYSQRALFEIDREEANFVKAIFTIKISDYKDLFSPISYAEKDLKEEQVWFPKNLVKLNLLSNKNTYIQSFLLGAAEGVEKALSHLKQDFIEEIKDEEQKKQVNALILRKNNELKEFVKNLDFIKKTAANSYLGDISAFKNGYKEGSNLKFNRALNKENGSFIPQLS